MKRNKLIIALVLGIIMAFSAMAFTGCKADKTELNRLIANCETLQKDNYTAETWAPFETALKKAKEIAAKPNASASEIKNAKNALQDALNKLKVKSDEQLLSEILDKIKGYDLSVADLADFGMNVKLTFGALELLSASFTAKKSGNLYNAYIALLLSEMIAELMDSSLSAKYWLSDDRLYMEQGDDKIIFSYPDQLSALFAVFLENETDSVFSSALFNVLYMLLVTGGAEDILGLDYKLYFINDDAEIANVLTADTAGERTFKAKDGTVLELRDRSRLSRFGDDEFFMDIENLEIKDEADNSYKIINFSITPDLGGLLTYSITLDFNEGENQCIHYWDSNTGEAVFEINGKIFRTTDGIYYISDDDGSVWTVYKVYVEDVDDDFTVENSIYHTFVNPANDITVYRECTLEYGMFPYYADAEDNLYTVITKYEMTDLNELFLMLSSEAGGESFTSIIGMLAILGMTETDESAPLAYAKDVKISNANSKQTLSFSLVSEKITASIIENAAAKIQQGTLMPEEVAATVGMIAGILDSLSFEFVLGDTFFQSIKVTMNLTQDLVDLIVVLADIPSDQAALTSAGLLALGKIELSIDFKFSGNVITFPQIDGTWTDYTADRAA